MLFRRPRIRSDQPLSDEEIEAIVRQLLAENLDEADRARAIH
jgi:hypothetical protein